MSADDNSIFAPMLADIEQHPMILQNKNLRQMKTREGIFFDYTTKVYQNHKDLINVLRKRQEVEKLKRIKEEAVKLGVELSYLVKESMYFASNDFLATVVKQFLAEQETTVDMNGVVIANLTAVYEITQIKFPCEKPKFEYDIPIKKFFLLFSDAITVLERIISSIHELCCEIKEEETEKLSVLDSVIEDCNKRLMKIDEAITEVKWIYEDAFKGKERNIAKRLAVDRECVRELFKEGLLHLWNSLFH